MQGCLRVFAVATFLFSISLQANEKPSIPEAWAEYVELDQKYNVYQRRSQILSDYEREIIPIYHFEVPLSESRIIQSKFMDATTASQVMGENDNGEKIVRFFVAVMMAIFIALAGIRVVRPLKDTHYLSEMESIKISLDRKIAQDQSIIFPVEINENGTLRVRYYFGDNYDIVKGPFTDREAYFLLLGHGQTGKIPKL